MMKKITCIVLNVLIALSLVTPSMGQQVYKYDFRNTLDETNSVGPALGALGTGSFMNEALSELSCMSRPVYGFTQNSGLTFDNAASGNFIGNTYSIEMYFQFLDNSGFKRIIDFKNQTSDFGLYCTSSIIQFYDALTVNTTAFVAGQYVYLVVTRDSASEDLNLYVDGALLGTFTDSTELGLLDGANVMNFFQDDLVFGGEARPGRIAMLNIHNTVLDGTTVSDNFSNLETTSGTLAFSVDITAACVNSNTFNFTNESENAGGFTYTWDFGDAITSVSTNATHSYTIAGNYTVLLIADDGAGCTDTVTTEVEVYAAAPIDLGPDVTICDGESTTLDAGNGFTTYLWSTGSSDQTIVVSASATYIATVTDLIGCSGTDTVVVDVAAIPVVNLGADITLCAGDDIILDAGSGASTYTWSTGDFTQTINVNTSGTYSVEVINAAGCSSSDTIVVDVNAPIVISLGADTSICSGSSITLDAGAGYSSYSWSDGSFGQTLNVNASGNYSVSVTDIFGCNGSDAIDVMVIPSPVIDLGADTTMCGGNTLVLDPGGSFVGFLWSTGSQNPTLNVTTAGNYSVIVFDINGCSGTDSIQVIVTPLVDLGPDQVWCTGLSTVLDAGVGMTSYLWSNGTSAQTLNVNITGIYTVTVTDGLGCINHDIISVAFNDVPTIELGTDFDLCNGEIGILNPGGGYSSYLWSDGSTDSVLFVTAAGTYSVTVSSAANCSSMDTVTVTILPSPSVDLGVDTVLCDGASLTLDAGAGFSSYLWTDGSSNQTLTITAGGTYDVTISSGNGCEAADTIEVTTGTLPVVDLGPDFSICDGTASIIDAGAGMANYLWSDGSNSQMFLVSAAGTYTVTVTNATGCTAQDDVNVSVITSPVVSLGADTTLCDGAQMTLDAGSGFATYLWNDGSGVQTYTVTAAGFYTITVTDGNNCSATDDIEVIYAAPIATPTITQNINTLQSSSATGNQWYSIPGGIIPGATFQTYNPPTDGTYYVVVFDANGCSSDTSNNIIFILDGVPSIGDVSIQVFPNPASDMISIQTFGWTFSDYKLELIDMIGKTIYSNESVQTGEFKLDISKYKSGMYFIRVSNDQVQGMQRLIINR